MPNNFDQGKIEEAIGNEIRNLGATKNLYYNRPRSSTENLKDFIVVKVIGSLYDQRAIGTCTLSVSLFAKDVSNIKNKDKLSYMQGIVINGMPRLVGSISIDDTPRILGDTSDGNGYHVRIIHYSLINKIV